MSDDAVSRRGFLTSGAGLAGAGAALIVSQAEAADGAKDDEAGFVAMPLSRYKKLNKVGGFEQAKLPDGTEVIVARVEDDKFACCSLKCPHANCDVEYDKKVKRFVCPCHNSQFDVNGKVKQGPARKDLQRFDTDPAVVVRTDPAD